MKIAKIGLLIAVCGFGISKSFAQGQTSPTPTESPASLKLSVQLSKNLQDYDRKVGVSRENREQAYAKLLEAQRSIYRMQMQRTRAGLATYAELARSSLLASLQFDPGLSESYVALTELSVISSPDIGEAVALCAFSIKLNNDSVGGHKFMARLLTKQSGLRGMSIDPVIAQKAIEEWKEVTRLDPRSSEAWAMLSEFYERTDKSAEAIEALRKWISASSPVDSGWFTQIVGGRPEELLPEQAPLRLAATLSKAGRTLEAIDVLSQQLSDDPDDADVIAEIQEVFETAKPGTSAAAIEPIRRVVISNPSSLTLLAFFAGLDARIGNVDEAVTMLRNAVDKIGGGDRPAAANLQLTIGDIYTSRDKFADAATAYEKALTVRGLDSAQTLDPDEREFAMAVFDKLINAYKRSNRIDDAKAAIARARKLLDRDDIFADRELVSLYREIGDRDRALSSVRTARARNPDDVSLLRLEATILTETGQVDKAVELIKQRIATGKSELPIQRVGENGKVAPRMDDDFSNYVFISQLYNTAGRGSDAASAAEQAYQLAGSDDRRQIALLMSATAKQTAGQFSDAESILRGILKKSPGNPIALNNLGYFLLERGERLSEAMELIQRAVAIDPTNPSYLDSLGWAYFKLGRIEEAIAKLEEASRLDDTSANIHEHLGDAYRKKGSIEQARRCWQRAFVLTSAASDAARVKDKLDNAK